MYVVFFILFVSLLQQKKNCTDHWYQVKFSELCKLLVNWIITVSMVIILSKTFITFSLLIVLKLSCCGYLLFHIFILTTFKDYFEVMVGMHQGWH